MNLRRWMLVPALVSLAVLPACSSGGGGDNATVAGSSPQATATDTNPGASGGEVTVHIKNFSYNPASFEVAKGQKITWINDDSAAHTSTLNSDAPEKFDTGNLGKGESKSFVPATAGTYNYICTIHQYMKASFTVK